MEEKEGLICLLLDLLDIIVKYDSPNQMKIW